jgi:hypothetical protein
MKYCTPPLCTTFFCKDTQYKMFFREIVIFSFLLHYKMSEYFPL